MNINNLPGEGRLDLVCRAVSSTFFLSHSFRVDTNLFLFLQSDSILISLYGKKITNLSPDERSIGGFLKRVFKTIEGDFSTKNNSSFSWEYFSIEDIPKYFPSGYILDKTGENYSEGVQQKENELVFVLGDHLGLNENDMAFFPNLTRISLGKKELHTSSCISIIHFLIDNY